MLVNKCFRDLIGLIIIMPSLTSVKTFSESLAFRYGIWVWIFNNKKKTWTQFFETDVYIKEKYCAWAKEVWLYSYVWKNSPLMTYSFRSILTLSLIWEKYIYFSLYKCIFCGNESNLSFLGEENGRLAVDKSSTVLKNWRYIHAKFDSLWQRTKLCNRCITLRGLNMLINIQFRFCWKLDNWQRRDFFLTVQASYTYWTIDNVKFCRRPI